MLDKMDERNMFLTAIASNLGGVKPTSFADFKQLVKSGNADKIYDVGDIITCEKETSITISKGDSTGVTGATINPETFLAAMGGTHGGVYEATFDGAVWKKEDGTPIDLATYGIAITGAPASGDHLVITETTTKLTWQILGFDEEDGLPAGKEHSVTLGLADIFIKAFQFDAAEALYFCETALPAGTYNVTLDHGAYDGGVAQDGTYQFTTTQEIPAGGGISHSTIGVYNGSGYTKPGIIAGKFTTYSDLAANVALESNIETIFDGEASRQ